MQNLITDIPGILVGNAHDAALASGVTALIFERPAVASIAIAGGAPGVRDTALLAPGMTVGEVDALVLSGGSAFGLDAMGGVQGLLREKGRGFAVGAVKVPIAPGAILFDLLNGGDKTWGRQPPYWDLGYAAARAAAKTFALGTAGAGFGATTANLKGGLGSASAITSRNYRVGALVAVNAVGSATMGDSAHFWAAPFEVGDEFGGRGCPPRALPQHLALRLKGEGPQNTTIAIVATDAKLGKEECERIAIMAQGGLARALRPVHAPSDGDVVFAAATGRHPSGISRRDLTELGLAVGDCLARAVARAIYEATALPFAGALPAWRGLHEAPGK